MPAARTWRALTLVAGFVAAAAVAGAQPIAPAVERTERGRGALDRAGLDAEIGRIFLAGTYDPPAFGPARWLPDGSGYSTIEPSAEGASDIVRYDAATGERRVLVPGSRLIPPTQKTALAVADYAWSADGARLLVFTNTAKVWRQHTRGDYWVLDLSSGRLRQLGARAPAATLMFAKFSPDGTRVAYVRANDLYVEQVDDGRVTALTTSGSETIINGTSDWVYEEELGVRDGFRWSPDGRRVAYWQFDTSGVGIFTLINNTDSVYPVTTRIPYPKPGTANAAARIGVVAASGGETRWMQTPGDPRDTYLARLEWHDADTLAIQQLNRLQNQQDLLSADAASGRVSRTFRDRSETWLDVVDQVRWVDRGRAFLWTSERDGWRHIYRATTDGAATTLVTPMAADITQIAGVDAAEDWVYFVASPGSATTRYLYRARLDAPGPPERVTPMSQPGTHSYRLAPGARLAFHTYSRFDVPPVTDVVELPGHRVLRTLTDTTALRQTLEPVLAPPVEFFTVDVGEGVTLDGWMLKPSHFDPARRYPLIIFVYGEPAGVTVTDQWHGGEALFHRALAEAGYVVVSVDNRGTPAPKGAPWRKAVYGTVGDLSSREQAAAVRALTARHAYLDASRVGVWGWSGGGSNTLNALFRFPEVYAVGVSVAPVPDQTLYDTIYQERYMGLPDANAAGYKLGSPIHFAEGLKGDLLIIHGSGDDNVHVQGTEKLVNRLVELGKPFDLMIYPNRTHAIAEGAGTTVHVYRKIAKYFLDHLPAGAR
jgi:dipeptidyl-peptidase-4